MQEIITERQLKKPRHSIYYRSLIDDSGTVVNEEAFDCRILVNKTNGNDYICIMDASGGLRREATRYVNIELVCPGFGTRRQTAGALQLFYTYCDLTRTDPKNMTIGSVIGMMNFLLGVTVQPVAGSQRTLRKDTTVNQIYGMIKKYVLIHKDQGWNTYAFSQTTNSHVSVPIGKDVAVDVVRAKDVNTLRTNSIVKRLAPKHVTPKQMSGLLQSMIQRKDTTGILISRLQYAYGLRSGEVLGLTEEDVVFETSADGESPYKLILRNRISDRLDQSCKGLFHPKSPDQYEGSLYKQSRWKIDISDSMYNQLWNYIRKTHNQEGKTEKWRRNYDKDMVADCVNKHPLGKVGKNHYIFAGVNGRRMSGKTWNNHLKCYFLENGIPIDEQMKTSNCSHRLRHGFAMLHAQYSEHPMTVLELQRALRHASPTTCYIYYTPLPEEELALRNSFLEEIDTLIPEYQCALKL